MPARKPADPSVRLALLRPAIAAVKKGEKANAEDMARIAQMTWVNLKRIINSDPAFPVISRGSEGIAWSFDVAKTLKYMVAACEAVLAERNKRAARMARLSGLAPDYGDAMAGEGQALTPGEITQLGNGQMTAHKLKMAQGQLMPRADTLAFLQDYHSQFQGEALGMLGKIDPAGQWPADVRRGVEDAMRTLLVNLQANMERFLDSNRVPVTA